MVGVVDGPSLQKNHACEAIHIIDSSDGGKFSSEAVSSNASQTDVLVIHEAYNVCCHFVEVEGGVVVRVPEIAGVK